MKVNGMAYVGRMARSPFPEHTSMIHLVFLNSSKRRYREIGEGLA